MKPIIIEANPEMVATHDEKNNNNNKRLRVAPYCRVSTASDLQLNSFEAQVKYYTEYVNNHPNWELVDVYSDEGISGTKVHKRNGLKRLMRDYRDGKIDMIICKSISRLCRNTADTLKIVRETRELGVDIYFENENIHTLSQGGEFLITIFASLAQDTSRQISDNVIWGQEKSMKNGIIYGNGTILGYDRVDKKLHINEEQAEIVRLIFRWYLEGFGMRIIGQKLEALGYKTATGLSKWSPTAIRSVLKNEKYCGRLLLRKSFTTDYLSHRRLKNKGEREQFLFLQDENGDPIIPPIISEAEFEAVQAELKKRSALQNNEKGRGTKHSNRHAFSCKIKCGRCGASFRRDVWHKGESSERVIWQCITYATRTKKECDNKAMPEDILRRAVSLVIDDIKKNDKKAIEVFMNVTKDIIEDTSHDKDIENIEMQIREQKEELKSLRVMRRRNEITEDEFMEDAEDLRATINQLENALNEVKEQQDVALVKVKKFEILQKTIQSEFSELDSLDDVIRNLVQKIVVRDRTDFDIYISGDIKANLSADLKSVSLCSTQYGEDGTFAYGDAFEYSTNEVLYRTFEWDFSDMVSKFSQMKKIYQQIKVNVYVKF